MGPYRLPAMTLAGVLASLVLPATLFASTSITLRWTAVGDDGHVGAAAAYDLRWSLQPITESSFASATPVVGVPAPRPAGTAEQFTVTNLPGQVNIYFALRVRDEAMNWSPLSNVATAPGQTVGVGDGPLQLSFSQPVPNPARVAARFGVSLPSAGAVRIEAFDLSGRRVRVVADGRYAPGRFDVVWDLADESGRRLEPGIYLVRATLPGAAWTRRVSIVN